MGDVRSNGFALSDRITIGVSSIPNGPGAVNLWDAQSFCWLDSLGGSFQWTTGSIQVGASAQGNTLSARTSGPFAAPVYGSARCANFGHGGPIVRPAGLTGFSWTSGTPQVQLASASAAVCYVSGMSGEFNGEGEAVYVFQRDGFWWLGGRAGSPNGVRATAQCISLPGDAPFTDPNMWNPRLHGWCVQAGGTLGVADMNGDGRADLWCHDPPNGGDGHTWVALSTPTGFGSSAWTPWLSNWCGQSGATFGTADFNADHRADFWCHDPGATWVALSTGSGIMGDPFTPWMSSWCTSPAQIFGTADLTGDAKADFWCHDPGGTTWVAASSGSGTAGDIWDPWSPGWCGSPGETFGTGSFNGDSKTDFYCHEAAPGAGRTWIATSTGARFSTSSTPSLSSWCNLAGQTFGTGDFDGDGTTDFFCHDPSAGTTRVALDVGSGFAFGGFQPLNGWCADTGASFGATDFNSDGKADLWCHNADATWTATSTGSAFGGDPWTPKLQGWCSQPGGIFLTADFNADTSADFLCHDPPASATNGDTWIAFR